MSTNIVAPDPPMWAEPEIAVVAELGLVGPVAERGDLLFAGLVELLRVSRVESLGDLRKAAESHDGLAGFLEMHEDNRAWDLGVEVSELRLDPAEDVRQGLSDWYWEAMPAPWLGDGGKGWELDTLIAELATVSGASPGGGADWIEFEVEVGELAARLRALGFKTVRVDPRVFEQFLDFPVGEIWVHHGEELTGAGDTRT